MVGRGYLGGLKGIHRSFVRFHPKKVAVYGKTFGKMKTAPYIWRHNLKGIFQSNKINPDNS
jgi:hypothetical protein